MTLQLPIEPQTRAAIVPQQARVMLVGTPGSGKTTLASGWAPKTTLILDTHHGTDLLPDEHFVQHVHDWDTFTGAVAAVTGGDHQYKTIVIDLVDDVFRFADRKFAGKNAPLASATDDWQKSINTAKGMFQTELGKLFATELGVWVISHAREKQDGNITRYSAELDNKVLTYVQGACQFVLLAETLGNGRRLHTQPSAKFEAKSRVPMPEPMSLDAVDLFKAMSAGLAGKEN